MPDQARPPAASDGATPAHTQVGGLSGRVAVVTGAGRGLGRAAAEALAQAGAHVALLGRTAADLDDAAAALAAHGVETLPVVTDVSQEDQVQRAAQAVLARFDKVDILVNNAGIAQVQPLLDLHLPDLQRLLSINVIGAMLCARHFGAPMVARKYGRIINMGSISGLMGEPGLCAYAASKGALLAFTRALAAEWARHGVTVNALAPGYFRTDLNSAAIDDPDIAPRMLRQIPLRRFGAAHELGPLLVYLASEASAFMTGSTLVIDGGQAAR